MELSILYVDDEQLNLDLFQINYSKNYKVLTSLTGKDALEILKSNKVDIAVSDYKMPEINGVELLTLLKQKQPNIKCILTSGYNKNTLEIPEDLLDAYILKPIKKKALINIIETL